MQSFLILRFNNHLILHFGYCKFKCQNHWITRFHLFPSNFPPLNVSLRSHVGLWSPRRSRRAQKFKKKFKKFPTNAWHLSARCGWGNGLLSIRYWISLQYSKRINGFYQILMYKHRIWDGFIFATFYRTQCKVFCIQG